MRRARRVRPGRCVLAVVALALSLASSRAAAQSANPDAAAVRTAVERFLSDLGQRKLEALPVHFAPKATMVVVRQREGAWSTVHQTFDEWLAQLKAQTPGTSFEEPLTNVTVQVESGQLAHLRADFTVVIGGAVRSHGVDYFTLVKDGPAWKIASAAYTSIPGAPK